LIFTMDQFPDAARRAQVPRTVSSPAGLGFCLVPWAGEALRPGAVGHGLVDQMCPDIPAAVFDAEADSVRS
jgi:hypothetical protein